VVKIPIYLHDSYNESEYEEYLTDYLGDRIEDFWIDDLARDILAVTYEVVLVFNTDTGKLEMPPQ